MNWTFKLLPTVTNRKSDRFALVCLFAWNFAPQTTNYFAAASIVQRTRKKTVCNAFVFVSCARTALQFVWVAHASRGDHYINETIVRLFISFENLNSKVPLETIETEIKSSTKLEQANEQEKQNHIR